jgi:hypothetical protein
MDNSKIRIQCLNNCQANYRFRDNANTLIQNYPSVENKGAVTLTKIQNLTKDDICIIFQPKVGFSFNPPYNPLIDFYDGEYTVEKIRGTSENLIGPGLKIIFLMDSDKLTSAYYYNKISYPELEKLINNNQGKILISHERLLHFSFDDVINVLNDLFSDDPVSAINDLVEKRLMRWM